MYLQKDQPHPDEYLQATDGRRRRSGQTVPAAPSRAATGLNSGAGSGRIRFRQENPAGQELGGVGVAYRGPEDGRP
jgi:hypothetical protein